MSGNHLSGFLPSELAHLQRLKFMSLKHNNFGKGLPPWLGALPELQHLLLGNNSFTGEIPQELGNLYKLKSLDMESNQLRGSVPLTLFNLSSLQLIVLTQSGISGNLPKDMCSHLPKLKALYLSRNQLYGEIPTSLHNCSQLEILSLSHNNFSGNIPREIGNLSLLKELHLGNNNLEGVVPQELGELANLEEIRIELNSIGGRIPNTIFNMSTLRVILFQANHLWGNLPSGIGQGLPNLEQLRLGQNNLSGHVVRSISNASKLNYLDLSYNSFMGSIPNSLGNLGFLETLYLVGNNFMWESSSSSAELSFLTSLTNCRRLRKLWISENPLNCILPSSIGNLSLSLEAIALGYSGLKGKIPNEIGNLSNLSFLSLIGNDLTGLIPTSVRELRKLQLISMEGNRIHGPFPTELCHLPNIGAVLFCRNRLSGPIPDCVGNATSLRYLYLDSNKFNSTLPASLWSLADLLHLNLSTNYFSGHLPSEIGNLKAATFIDLSVNLFSGVIPSTVEGLQSLINLSVAHNRLQGPISESFGRLLSLELLDLSENNLSGVIPKSLETLRQLKYFNVSSNRLRGEIPSEGPFANFTSGSFMFNEALCGAPRFQVIQCKSSSSKPHVRLSRNRAVLFISILLPLISMPLVLTFAFLCIRWRRRNRILVQPDQSPVIPCERIPYHDLVRATNGFSETNLLGMGSFGSVYRGTRVDGETLAVKIFNLEVEGAFKSFEAESEILRNIRHRNLVKVITACSNLDFKALVLAYMSNGSLEKWLHCHGYFLDTLQRLNAMIDVACALEYLHHGCSTPVVHCDLKPNNVLLDEHMVAHVADFGIGKILAGADSTALTKALATFGYIAPEYGSEGMVSTRCDVYSYGIMLMETFTRKKPTDEMFVGNLSLKGWVKESLSNGIFHIIDCNLLRLGEEDINAKVQCVLSVMDLALKCSAESPQERLNMTDALAVLKKIRLQFLASCGGS